MRRKGKFMGFFKLFLGKSPEEAEKKADALFEAGEYGLAKMEYENGLEKWRKGAQGSEALEERLKEKLRKTREILAHPSTMRLQSSLSDSPWSLPRIRS